MNEGYYNDDGAYVPPLEGNEDWPAEDFDDEGGPL